jgi:hypothetical protein
MFNTFPCAPVASAVASFSLLAVLPIIIAATAIITITARAKKISSFFSW